MSVGTEKAEQADQQAAAQAQDDKQAAAATGAAQGNEGEDEDEDAEPDPLMIARWAAEETGIPYTEQFRDDKAFAKHLEHLERTVGQRNEDAQLGKQVRERLGKEGVDLEALLAGRSEKKPQPSDGLPEFRDEWITFDEQGQAKPTPGAPPDAVHRFLRRLVAVAGQTDKVVRNALAPELEQLRSQTEKTQAEVTQRQDQQVLDAAIERHKKVLYVGGDKRRGLTPIGQKIVRRIEDRQAAEMITTGRQAALELDWAVEDLAPPQTKTDKTNQRQVSNRAVRQPGIAPASDLSEKELDTLLSQGAAGLAKALRESAERQKAAET